MMPIQCVGVSIIIPYVCYWKSLCSVILSTKINKDFGKNKFVADHPDAVELCNQDNTAQQKQHTITVRIKM